jgi:para-nitrobenzyl esterase
LRWKAPRPLVPWERAREMLTEPPACVQPRSEPGKPPAIIGQEDCLYLDLYAPAMSVDLALTRRLPVMVWIHGGANIAGSAGDYDAGQLALQRQVLVVVPNYRLGPLGWFSHPALDDGPPPLPHGDKPRLVTGDELRVQDDRSGNYGTLDMIAALQFVRENITRFGGDPQNVTIFGESAGAADVLSLLLSPRAKGLFQHAIAESPVLYSTSMNEAQAFSEDGGAPSSASEVLARLLIADGRAADRNAARALIAGMDRAQNAAYLRAATPQALLAAALQPRPAGDDRPPDFPTVLRDGTVIFSEPPLERFARGDYNQVPIILGTNRDEIKLFQAQNPELVARDGSGRPQIKDHALYALLAEYRSDAWRAGTIHAIAPLLAKAQRDSVYVYRFDWDEQPHATGLDELIGAAHAMELDFVFDVFAATPRTHGMYDEHNARGRKYLARAVMAYWSELAYEGSPGMGRANDLIDWEPWGEQPAVLVLDTKAGGDLRMEHEAASVPELLARLAADARAPRPIDKCRVLYWLTQRGRSVPKDAYATTPGIDCSAFPVERYPWKEAP